MCHLGAERYTQPTHRIRALLGEEASFSTATLDTLHFGVPDARTEPSSVLVVE
jgi:hypothetical protein